MHNFFNKIKSFNINLINIMSLYIIFTTGASHFSPMLAVHWAPGRTFVVWHLIEISLLKNKETLRKEKSGKEEKELSTRKDSNPASSIGCMFFTVVLPPWRQLDCFKDHYVKHLEWTWEFASMASRVGNSDLIEQLGLFSNAVQLSDALEASAKWN